MCCRPYLLRLRPFKKLLLHTHAHGVYLYGLLKVSSFVAGDYVNLGCWLSVMVHSVMLCSIVCVNVCLCGELKWAWVYVISYTMTQLVSQVKVNESNTCLQTLKWHLYVKNHHAYENDHPVSFITLLWVIISIKAISVCTYWFITSYVCKPIDTISLCI